MLLSFESMLGEQGSLMGRVLTCNLRHPDVGKDTELQRSHAEIKLRITRLRSQHGGRARKWESVPRVKHRLRLYSAGYRNPARFVGPKVASSS